MSDFLKLLRFDVKLLNRNRLFALAAVVAAIYIGIFFLFKSFGSMDNVLVVLIFNDPVITGYLFAAVLLLFDKNQNTIQAISVLPIPFKNYLLSKMVVLSLLATVLALIMALAGKGLEFNVIHLMIATFLSAAIFSALGFAVSAISSTFNQLLLYSVPIFIITGLPILILFGYGSPGLYVPLPSLGGVGLLQAAFTPKSGGFVALMYVHLALSAAVSWQIAVKVTERRLLL